MEQLGDEQDRVARLETLIEAREPTPVSEELNAVKTKLDLVTTPGVEVCALRPMGDQPDARAIFYRHDDRWMIAADQLDPCEEGQHYQVWFKTDQGTMPGRSFNVKEKGRIEISAEEMPEGTTAVLITLESVATDENTTDGPTGPMVLYGDEPHVMI